MTAVAREQIAALAQRRRQIKTSDATTRPAPFATLAANNDRRAIKFLQHARRDNTDDADVPEQLSFDDDKIGFGIKPRTDGTDDFPDDATLDLLPLAISQV